ncbi:hypothetical protein EVA_08693 [gut metagenome]|uniref:Uncharacterized protein n=1 Tax=gut metagenome TaxID=749906 RepID=J9CSM3_9ZZZZ
METHGRLRGTQREPRPRSDGYGKDTGPWRTSVQQLRLHAL